MNLVSFTGSISVLARGALSGESLFLEGLLAMSHLFGEFYWEMNQCPSGC